MAINYQRPQPMRPSEFGAMYPTAPRTATRSFNSPAGIGATGLPQNRPVTAANNFGSQVGSLISEGRPALSRDFLRAALRRRAMRRAANRRKQGGVQSRLLGFDPMQARGMQFDVEQQAQGDLSDQLGEAELADLGGYQDFIRQLLLGERGREFEAGEREKQRRFEEEQGGFDLGGFLGETAGGLVAGPIGSAIGGRIAGGRR